MPAAIVADKQAREAAKTAAKAHEEPRRAEQSAADAVAKATERLRTVGAGAEAAEAKTAAKAGRRWRGR